MEVEKILFYPYELKPKSTPNRLSGKESRKGCLIRVKFKEFQLPGHADLFPWPELGDPSLEDQIDSLRDLTPFSQAAATLMWAYYEAHAIEKKKSLLSDADYPSHVTLTESMAIPSYAKTVKFKINSIAIHNWRETEKFIKEYPTLLWRLDFNGLFKSKDEAQSFWSQVNPSVKSQIEFLEDPYIAELMEDAVALKVFDGTQIALDRAMTDKSLDLSDVWVIKPVYYSPDYLFDQAKMYEGKIAITSNMDHPLGQIIALHAAQKIQSLPDSRVIPGGLLTHDLYEDHPQKNWVTQIQKQLKPRFDGVGWGLIDELNKLSWVTK